MHKTSDRPMRAGNLGPAFRAIHAKARHHSAEGYGWTELPGRRRCGPYGRHRRLAALNGNRYRVGAVSRQGALHRNYRRLPDLSPWWQPFPDRGASWCIHRAHLDIVERHGYNGLVLATLMAGPMMLVVGFLRLGTYIKYIPFPVTVGFTAGIAVIIFASQVKELLGLDIVKEPAALIPKIGAITAAIYTVKPPTVACRC